MKFKKVLNVSIIVLMIYLAFVGCSNKDISENTIKNEDKPIIAVSIVPQKTFIKAVAGDLVNVITMIPPGNSPANYKPTPKQMVSLSDAKIYFTIGVPTEKANIIPKLEDINENIKLIALEDKVSEFYPVRYFNKEVKENKDPHIWLSPKRVKVMVKEIRDELINLDPKNKDTYSDNASKYLNKLNRLDNEIKESLSGLKSKDFITYHPSLGYFSDDYGLNMISIEKSGKEATTKRLQQIIDLARKKEIKYILYQKEFDGEQAKTIASEINGETIKYNPLSGDYIKNIKNIINTFNEVLN
ncbi:MAG: ABC transporter substrate-binding protein [Firmicutes bacterium]|nr:ABC transporter substrate-binding protein [Bacillota bacterium]